MPPLEADPTVLGTERQLLMARALAVILAPDFVESDGLTTDAIGPESDAPTLEAPGSCGAVSGCHNSATASLTSRGQRRSRANERR